MGGILLFLKKMEFTGDCTHCGLPQVNIRILVSGSFSKSTAIDFLKKGREQGHLDYLHK